MFLIMSLYSFFFFFSSRRRHTRLQGDWSSDVCSSDLVADLLAELGEDAPQAGAGELGGGVERGTQVFPRQETPHRPPEERAATQLLGEPAAARGTEQEAAAKRHGSGLDSAARRRSVGEAAY